MHLPLSISKLGIRLRKKSLYKKLRDKWINRHRETQKVLWDKHAPVLTEFFDKSKELIVGSVAGIMLLVSPPVASHLPQLFAQKSEVFQTFDTKTSFLLNLSQVVPQEVRPLRPNEEQKITQLLSGTFGLSVTPELQGVRLDRNYGLIGQEQHLARFPGDMIYSHFKNSNEANSFASYGMAPGLGAYGYFAFSQNQMTPEQDAREKYYIAIQTFMAPGFADNPKKYNDFFAFRKMLVVNPDNGKAIVADIGDAGPAVWTGKHLGGSPEVMRYLERFDGAQRGPVLYFFIDDPTDKVPLGPIGI